MDGGFSCPQPGPEFEEPVAKRLRLDHNYHHYLAGLHVSATAPEQVYSILDRATSGSPSSSVFFDRYGSGHLPDSQGTNFYVPADLSSNFDLFSNIPVNYEEHLHSFSNGSRLVEAAPTQPGLDIYGQFAPNHVDDRSEISQAVLATNRSLPDEGQICFGMVGATILRVPPQTS